MIVWNDNDSKQRPPHNRKYRPFNLEDIVESEDDKTVDSQ